MSQQERKPHKHAEIIKAWADGATIQWRRDWGLWPTDWADWTPDVGPGWDSAVIFRVKPEPLPAGDVLMRCYAKATEQTLMCNDGHGVWAKTAKLFMQEIKNGNVKEQ